MNNYVFKILHIESIKTPEIFRISHLWFRWATICSCSFCSLAFWRENSSSHSLRVRSIAACSRMRNPSWNGNNKFLRKPTLQSRKVMRKLLELWLRHRQLLFRAPEQIRCATFEWVPRTPPPPPSASVVHSAPTAPATLVLSPFPISCPNIRFTSNIVLVLRINQLTFVNDANALLQLLQFVLPLVLPSLRSTNISGPFHSCEFIVENDDVFVFVKYKTCCCFSRASRFSSLSWASSRRNAARNSRLWRRSASFMAASTAFCFSPSTSTLYFFFTRSPRSEKDEKTAM